MNIKIFIFNMLFLIILIALIYIHMYLSYNNSIETFVSNDLMNISNDTGQSQDLNLQKVNII